MTNKTKTTLYVGVTNDLARRIKEHKDHLNENSFTAKYHLEYCVYYEELEYFQLAIKREKEIKKWRREKKENLINTVNPDWKELKLGDLRKKYVPFNLLVSNLLEELKGIEEEE